MRYELKKRRKEFNLTQSDIADAVGISKRHYQAIEQGRRFPSEYVLKKLLKTLDTDSVSLMNNEEPKRRGEVSKNICEYMNLHSRTNKKYTVYEVNAIRASIRIELKDRKAKKLDIKKTEDGRKEINKRISEIANEKYKTSLIHDDVMLWRICCRQEFTDRTGKCTWGIPAVRRKLGFNGITGHELKE